MMAEAAPQTLTEPSALVAHRHFRRRFIHANIDSRIADAKDASECAALGGCCGGWTEAVPRGTGQCKDLVVHTALCCKYKYDSNWERAVKRKFEFENIQFWGAEDVEMNSSLIFGPINLPTHLQNRHLVSNYSTMTWRCSQIVYESPMKMF
jgi:hypothetical protein